MHVLALRMPIIAASAFPPGDALCADPCEARYGTGRRPLTPATGSPGEFVPFSAPAAAFAPREDATFCRIKAGTVAGR